MPDDDDLPRDLSHVTPAYRRTLLTVLIAAGLVAWTATPWPDLAAAFVIASLFLQSSWSIIRDARSDLAAAGHAPRR